MVFDDSALKRLGKQHFGVLFKDDDSNNLANQLKVISLFPTLTVEEDVDRFLDPITSQEVEEVLKGLKKRKSMARMVGLLNSFCLFLILLGMNWFWLQNMPVLEG